MAEQEESSKRSRAMRFADPVPTTPRQKKAAKAAKKVARKAVPAPIVTARTRKQQATMAQRKGY